MTNFNVKCETLLRFLNLCSFFEPSVETQTVEKLNAVYLENKDGMTFIVATNSMVAAVERVGFTQEPDGFAYFKNDETIKNKIKQGSLEDLTVKIVTLPQFAMSTLTIGNGSDIVNCCKWFDDSPFKNWRNWFQDQDGDVKGFMYWDVFHVESLMKASKSGCVIFPEKINAEKPIIIRDRYNPEWVGSFFPQPPVGQVIVNSAKKPEWLK